MTLSCVLFVCVAGGFKLSWVRKCSFEIIIIFGRLNLPGARTELVNG